MENKHYSKNLKIPKELELLAQEARKYKSAEEFLNNFNIITDEDLMPVRKAYAEYIHNWGRRGVLKTKQFQLEKEFSEKGRLLAGKIAQRLGLDWEHLLTPKILPPHLRKYLKKPQKISEVFDFPLWRYSELIGYTLWKELYRLSDSIGFYGNYPTAQVMSRIRNAIKSSPIKNHLVSFYNKVVKGTKPAN